MFAAMIQSMTMPKPRPVVIPPSMVDTMDAELQELEKVEYKRLAGKLGMTLPLGALIKSRETMVLQWLKENRIGIYDMQEVGDFLKRQCRIESRKLAKKGDGPFYMDWYWAKLTPFPASVSWGRVEGFYSKPVPLPVLHLVEKMSDAFPNQIGFVVSDYRVVNPDPFLAVVTSREGYVIAHWDEPSFKGKAK